MYNFIKDYSITPMKRPLLATALLLLQPLVPVLHAQVTWDGGGGDGLWSTGLNWTGDNPPSGSAGAGTFSGTTRTVNTNDISGLIFSSLTFNNSSWTLSGDAFTLTSGITGVSGQTVTISNNVIMSNAANVTLQTQNAAASKLVLSGDFSAAARIISKDGGGVTNNANTSDLIFNGNGRTVSIGEFRHRKGGVIFSNGVNATIATNQLGNDATFVGIDPFQTITGSATVVSNTSIEIGRQANAARLTLESGTFNVGTMLTGQSASALTNSGYYQTGGTANIATMRLGNNGGSTAQITGGVLNVTGATSATNSSAFKLVEGGTSIMTIGDTAEVVMGAGGGGIFQLATGTGNGTLHLDGGTLTTIGFYKNNTTGTTTINLNGGTLKAGASTTGFLNANVNTTVNVKDGGAVVDTVGFNVTIKADLLNGGTGGLRKTGDGTLTLEGNNTFTGVLDVEQGRVSLASAGGAAAGAASGVEVTTGATLLLAASDQVNNSAAVTLSGGTILRANGVSEVFGDLNQTSASFLDFGNVAMTGNLSFGTYTPSGLLTVKNFLEGNTLVFKTNLSGSITNNTLFSFDNGFSYNWNGGTSTFTITAIPEPATLIAGFGLAALFGFAFLRRRFTAPCSGDSTH